MFCSGSRFENVRAGPASYVVFGARKLTSKRSRSGNAVRSDPCLAQDTIYRKEMNAIPSPTAAAYVADNEASGNADSKPKFYCECGSGTA